MSRTVLCGDCFGPNDLHASDCPRVKQPRRGRRTLYRGIMIDPPWNETGGTAPKGSPFGAGARGADQHYPVLKTPEIPPAILASGLFNPAPDSHLYLWVTNNYLEDGVWVMNQLGFRLIQKIEWVKAPRVPVWVEHKPGLMLEPIGGRLVYPDRDFGLGRYFRGKTETCLFGVRGTGLSVCTPAKNVTNLIVAPKTRHSRKPPEAYLKVEERTKPPFLEMFGRGSFGRANWSIWGNESI